MKKALSILLSLLMAFSAFSVMPFSAKALSSGQTCPDCGSGVLIVIAFNSTQHALSCSNTHCAHAASTGYFWEDHHGGNACTEKPVCEVCGQEYGSASGHSWKTEWSYDGTTHWHACDNCTAKKDEAAHSFEATARYCLNGCGAENPNYTGTPASTLTTGDTFEMGMYPQTKVTDDATIMALAAIDCTMTSYGYIKNTNETVDMTYGDIVYDGAAYRKVTITENRPYYTTGTSSYQPINGYKAGETYYFKWEPVVWQVLAKEADGVYVMSKSLLDSQAYHNVNEDTTWENCTLRTWLNDGFYNAAFSDGEKDKIVSYTHENEDHPIYNTDGGNNTTDNLWVLSYSDAINTNYGFSASASDYDEARRAQGTDYAKSQNIWVSTDSSYPGNSEWWMRTPGDYSHNACGVVNYGYSGGYYHVNHTGLGIRPAFKLKLDSTVSTSDSAICRVTGEHDYGDGYVCTICGNVKEVTSVRNYTDLKELARQVNAGKDYSGKTVVLENDIVCKNDTDYATDWTPIGNESISFKGTFDGKGYTITGLSNSGVSSKPEYVGMFGCTKYATIKNLGMVNETLSGDNYVGGIVAQSVNSKIENCYLTKGSLSLSAMKSGPLSCGGIVGKSVNSTVENCYSANSLSLSVHEWYSAYCGGIVGISDETSVIKNCYHSGSFSSSGGSCGLGGIAGQNKGKVENCYNTGELRGAGKAPFVGGIAAYNTDTGQIVNCYNKGLISASGSAPTAGGIVSGNDGTIRFCYNTASVIGIASGYCYCGGIAHQNAGDGKIINCYNTGDISCSGSIKRAGGIVALNSATLENCYNTGKISSSGDDSRLGGLIGFSDKDTKCQNCYSAGLVKNDGPNDYCGGLVGYIFNESEYAYCYYDNSFCPDVGAVGSGSRFEYYHSDKVVGLTTAQMTGENALDNMEFSYEEGETSPWLTKTDGADGKGNYYFYYPHLKGFDFADDSGQRVESYENGTQMKAEDILSSYWPPKVKVSMSWNEKNSYTYDGTVQAPELTSLALGDDVLEEGCTAYYEKYENGSWGAATSSVPTETGSYRMTLMDKDGYSFEKMFYRIALDDINVSYKKSGETTWEAVTETKNAGDYKVLLAIKNGEVNVEPGHPAIEHAFTINKAKLTITGKDRILYYNGAAQGPAGTYTGNFNSYITYSGLVSPDAITSVTVSGSETNVGTYSITPSAVSLSGGTDNYDIELKSGTLTIQPASLTITVKDQEYTYNGTAKGENNATYTTGLDSKIEVDGLEGSDALTSITLNGQETNAGEYTGKIVASAAEIGEKTGNYNIGYTAGKLTIEKANATVTITGNYNTTVFDGDEHAVSGYTSRADNDIYDVTKFFTFSGTAEAKRTDEGTTMMGLVAGMFANTNNNFSVTFNVSDGYQQIVPKQINDITDITLDGSTYDGTAKTLTVKLGDKALAAGADYSVAIKNAEGAAVSEIIGAGEYTVTVTGKGNYTGSVTKTVTVAPAKITVTAEDKESNHGLDLLALTYKIGGNYVDGDELGITLNADIDNTKPGAYTITPSWNGNANYTATLVDGTYTVGDDPHYYGTQGDERFTCTVCGAVDDNLKAQAEAADKDAADTAAANAVTEMINALPEKEEITTADEAAIKKAREAYDSLTDDQKAKVAPETVNKLKDAEKALAEEKAEEATAAKEKAKAEFIAGVDGTSTDSSIIVKWGKVPNAKRYVIYAAYCDKNHKYKYKKIKTVSGKVTKYEIKKLYGKKLNPKRNIKAYVVAYRKVNGKYRKIAKSIHLHVAGFKSKRTNTKAIKLKKSKFTLKVGKTAKIKGSIVLEDSSKKAVNHVRKFRFKSSNKKVATVSRSGKIKAKGKGTCTIYVFANNGKAKKVKVTVK